MDTSMPLPNLPLPASSQTPEFLVFQRPASASSASLVPCPVALGQSRSVLPDRSKDSKDDEKTSGGGGGHPKEAMTIPIEELQLPKSIITRLAKGVLPPNTQIQANAILAMTKSATVFINHLANAANEVTTLQNKKTVMPADVFRALDDIEFGFMRERVEAEFNKFNEVQTNKRSNYRKKVAAAKKAAKQPGDPMASADGDAIMADVEVTAANSEINSNTNDGQQPRAKKARTDGNDHAMDVDGEQNDASDLDSIPDEEGEEEEEEEEEEAQDGDDVEEDDEDGDQYEENQDQLEERENRPDHDEALDDGNNSD